MPITVTIDKEAGIRINEVSGELTLDEILSALRKLYEGPDFNPDMDVLWDLRNASVGAISFEEIKYIADFVSGFWGTSGTSRAAFVVSRNEHYGMVRMYEQLMDSRSLSKVMAFRDRDEAISWLANK